MRSTSLVVALVLCGVVAIRAQAPEPAFEVASIRPAMRPAPYSFRILPGRLVATTVPLSTLIARAYGVPSWRTVGLPRWATEDVFDIQARSEEPAAPDKVLAMLRTLLEERFRLVAEWESREVDADLLVLSDRNGGKGPGRHAVDVDCEANRLMPGSGPGLFPAESRPSCGHSVHTVSFTPGTENFRGEVNRRSRMSRYSAITIQQLADLVSSIRGRPALDRTGLSGRFDMQLEYVADPLSAPGASAPPLEVALEQQLGLELRPGRGQVEFLIIRSVQQPTPN